MKAIKLKIQQQTANFRKPTSRKIQESYPLPPYSTISGFIHAMCGYDSYHDMKLSIQGMYQSKTIDFARQKYIAKRYEASRHDYDLDGIGLVTGIASIELLINLTTIVHIVPSDKDFDHILSHLKRPIQYPCLGRHEDLANISDVEVVELSENTYDEDIKNQYAAYIPIDLIDDLIDTSNQDIQYSGTYFKFGKKYEIDKKTNKRVFHDKKDILYTTNYHIFADETILTDQSNCPVFLV